MSVCKIGVVGCGSIAQGIHLNILPRLPGVEVAAIAEPDPERREAACRKVPNAKAFDDYQEVVDLPGLDAVLIALPNALHADAAVTAFAHNKHVYLEKPVAIDLDEAWDIVEAWQSSGGKVGQVGFNYRFNPLYRAAKERLATGVLGDLVSVRSVFSTAAAWNRLPDWKLVRETGGGVLLDLASHHIDLIHFFFGQPVCEVSAAVLSQRSEVPDSAVLNLRLAGGLLVQTFVSLSAVDEDKFEFYGSAGKLTVDRYYSVDVEVAGPRRDEATRLKAIKQGLHSVAKSPYLLEKRRAVGNEPSYQAALGQFVTAAGGGGAAGLRPDLLDGYRSLRVVEAAEESVRTGRVVALTGGDEATIHRVERPLK
uniref:GH109 n=1 Tax=uncultured Armatimonadetes bacterium TaxID=157466 RepID=A0A6J4H351_9BACT|nr:GH109 [uncultured Armatimonadetes bacterium]